jgi:chromosome segregation ATPase
LGRDHSGLLASAVALAVRATSLKEREAKLADVGEVNKLLEKVEEARKEVDEKVRGCREQVQRYPTKMKELEMLRGEEADIRETMAAIEALRLGLVELDGKTMEDGPLIVAEEKMRELEAEFGDDAALEAALARVGEENRAARAELARQRRAVSEELRRAADRTRALGAALEAGIRFCESPI